MISPRLAGLVAAALLLAACGDRNANSGAVTTDSTAATTAGAPETAPVTPAPPTGIAGAPGVAQRGVDSANAAYQRQESEVNNLSQPNPATTP